MKPIFCRRSVSSALWAALFLCANATGALAAESGAATVSGLLGLAQYSKPGGTFQPLKVGAVIGPGDVVQTASGSALDLNLGKDIGTVRLLQSTTLGVTALSSTGVELDIKGGEVLGRVTKRPPGSQFEIEVPGGVAGIVEGDFRLNSRGYLVLLEGVAVYVEARTEGDPLAHTLKGDGAVYFSPIEHAVRPAPKQLEREVRTQLKVRLPKK